MSNWSYKYKLSPLMKDLVSYLKDNNKNIIDQVNKELEKDNVSNEKYMNFEDHMNFVTPNIPENQIIINLNKDTVNNKNYLVKIAKLVVNKDKKVQKYLNCDNVKFLNKCDII